MSSHRGDIRHLEVLTADTLSVDWTDKVVVVALVPVEVEVDTVVDETESDTDVKLVLFLVGKFAVGDILKCDTDFAY